MRCKHPFLALTGSVLLALGVSKGAPAQNLTQAPADFQELVEAAQAEGSLVVMGYLRRWANFGEIFDTFTDRYGIRIRQLAFDASSADQMDAIRDNMGDQGSPSLAPDVVMVPMADGPAWKASGLGAPYQVMTWSSIPDRFKDPDGIWFGGFYGNLVFEVNTGVVEDPPKDWPDLLQPGFLGKFALGGSPDRGSLEALTAVAAAGQAAGGSPADPRPGLEFFRNLNEAGNLLPIIGFWGSVCSGDAPVAAAWDFNAMHDQDQNGAAIGMVTPASGLVAGVYAQGISAYAQHPNAARLYEEFLLSDEGQTLWLKGHAHPIRLDDLVRRNVVSDQLLGCLPEVPAGVKTWIPTAAELEAARKACTEQWALVVGEAR